MDPAFLVPYFHVTAPTAARIGSMPKSSAMPTIIWNTRKEKTKLQN